MGKMKISKILIVFVGILLIGWPLYQIYKELNVHTEQQNGAHLFYQVSLFQMEIMNSSFAENASWTETRQLSALKLAAYSVNYTHERFTVLVGANKLAALQSMARMMDYIDRLQIGGNRLMTPDEKASFQEAGKLYKQLYEAYNHLMADNAINIVSAQNAKLKKLDHTLSDFFNKKLLH